MDGSFSFFYTLQECSLNLNWIFLCDPPSFAFWSLFGVFFLKEILFMHLNVFLLGTGKKLATRWIFIANLLFLVPSLGISIHFEASVFHNPLLKVLDSAGSLIDLSVFAPALTSRCGNLILLRRSKSE